MKIVQDLARLYFLEPISMCWMGNHWHLVLYAGDQRPSVEEIANRYNAYYTDLQNYFGIGRSDTLLYY